MKIFAVALIIIAILGIVLSVFPNLITRSMFSGRQNPNQNFNFTRQNYNRPAFDFTQILVYAQTGLWIVVLIIGVLLIREPKKTKG